MPINKEEVLTELREMHQAHTEMGRRLFALSMKVQNMVEAPARSMTHIDMGSASVTHEPGRVMTHIELPETGAVSAAAAAAGLARNINHPHDRSGHTPPQVAHIWQSNTQDVVNASKAPTAEESLSAAKEVFKTALAQAGLPAHLAALSDNVTLEILEAHRAKQAPPQLPSEMVQPSAADVEAQAARDSLATFIGRGSIFMEYLSADVMFGARGVLKPGVLELKRYGDDARWVEESSLRHWKTGFYTDRDSKGLQFLVNSDLCATLIEALPSESSPVRVLVYGTRDGWKQIQDYLPSEQKLVFAKVEDALDKIEKKS